MVRMEGEGGVVQVAGCDGVEERRCARAGAAIAGAVAVVFKGL